jgi:outer membrane protein assembly factor BamB
MRTATCLGLIAAIVAVGASTQFASAQQRLLVQGNGRLAIVASSGEIEWEMPWGPIHDLHMLHGHIFVQQGPSTIAEIDPKTKKVVWSYDSATQNGNAGKQVEVHGFQPLDGGRLMIAESGPGRIIEIDRGGQLLKEIKLRILHPHPHTDTRLARKLTNGNYLVCHEGDGTVREYDGQSGDVVWEFEVPLFGRQPKDGHGPEAFGNKCFAAVRLANGHTLITTGNGHSVLEVTREKEIVRKIEQKDSPGITLAWVTTLEVLPNGHWLIGNCHAGPGNPLVIELDPETQKVVWKFDGFKTFGNNVSNTLAIEGSGGSKFIFRR